MMQFRRNIRGISAAFASLLLVIITCIAGFLLYSFGLGMIEEVTESPSTQPFSLCIETISVNGTCMKIFVRNWLDQQVRVVNVYINDNSYSVFVSGDCVDVIPQNQTRAMHIKGLFTSGCLFNVRVVFDTGYSLLTCTRG